MKGTILFGMALLLAGCGNALPVKNQGLLTCTHPTDAALNFSYDPKTVEVWTTEKFGIQNFTIETSSGEQLRLNSYEIQQYKCKES